MLSQSLAGSCDSKLNGGNGNQQVELFEIEKYMRSKSQEYAALRSTSSPLPKLFTNLQHADHDRPFVVTWAIANSVSKRPIAPGQTAISARDIEQSHRDMEATWRTIESLRSKHPWHEYPVEWAKLIYYAVCIEEATFGRRRRGETSCRMEEAISATRHRNPRPDVICSYRNSIFSAAA